MKELDSLAEAYVKLVLAVGRHDEHYVDAYYGPAEWRDTEGDRDLEELVADTASIRSRLEAIEEGPEARRRYLAKQLRAVAARIDHLSGVKQTFDEEAERLYDARPPRFDRDHFDALLEALDRALPGQGTLSTRLQSFRDAFLIPPDKLDTVFRTAVEEARKRTTQRIELPEHESFEIEYVKDKPWSGYNWYKGNAYSLIQVNVDLPIAIDRAVDLACHEGYPGHHVYNVLIEKHLARDRGWVEFSVYPLFSPQSLIAEGSANYGIEVAFPGKERLAFEREVLFPLAGLDPDRVEEYYRVLALTQKLTYAGNEAARHYLNEEWNSKQTIDWLVRYGLFSPERARQRLRFIETYRAYVINYNLGQDMVADHIESAGGTEDDPGRRWQLFAGLLSEPAVPSDLKR